MYVECAGNLLHVQEFPAKCRKFPAQFAYVQEKYEEALILLSHVKNEGILQEYLFLHFFISSCTFFNSSYILPTHFKILPSH